MHRKALRKVFLPFQALVVVVVVGQPEQPNLAVWDKGAGTGGCQTQLDSFLQRIAQWSDAG